MNLEDASSSKLGSIADSSKFSFPAHKGHRKYLSLYAQDLLEYMGIKYQLVQTNKTSSPILDSISFRNELGCPNKLTRQVTIDNGAHKI
ncbi:hypothetical protein I79_002052 [Cricetulus griseus]|uniref:Uncharacterized protein n=1 Tax=Cricetulus griseus TaxID=10029 RepID=G3GWD1_CRIGR|nr:hypothetical protein I79_002052 [Cricetulus griseus]